MMFGCSEGMLLDGLLNGFDGDPDALENEFRWLEFAEPDWYGTLQWKRILLQQSMTAVVKIAFTFAR